MSASRRRWIKSGVTLLVLWVLTLGIHMGSLPDGVPVNGTKDSYFWDEFLDGKREFDFMAFMEVPHYQVGIPFLFTYAGGAMPASVDLAVTTDQQHADATVVIEKASLKYDDGQRFEIVWPENPRSGILVPFTPFESDRREGRTFYRAQIGIPHCVWEKQDFTVEFSGYFASAAGREKFSGSAGVIYSENRFVYLGWFLLLLRGV